MLRQLGAAAASAFRQPELASAAGDIAAWLGPATFQSVRQAKALSIVLLEDYEPLGKKGQVVEVKPGYMRNFLYPKRLAVYATPKNLAKYRLAHDEGTGAASTEESEIDTVLQLLSTRTLVTKRRVSWRSAEKQRMVGQVTAADVAEMCRRQLSIELDPAMVMMPRPIAAFGEFKVPLNLLGRDGQQLELGVQVLKTVRVN